MKPAGAPTTLASQLSTMRSPPAAPIVTLLGAAVATLAGAGWGALPLSELAGPVGGVVFRAVPGGRIASGEVGGSAAALGSRAMRPAPFGGGRTARPSSLSCCRRSEASPPVAASPMPAIGRSAPGSGVSKADAVPPEGRPNGSCAGDPLRLRVSVKVLATNGTRVFNKSLMLDQLYHECHRWLNRRRWRPSGEPSTPVRVG